MGTLGFDEGMNFGFHQLRYICLPHQPGWGPSGWRRSFYFDRYPRDLIYLQNEVNRDRRSKLSTSHILISGLTRIA